MKRNKLAEDYVKFQASWMAGAAVGHGIAYVLGKILVFGVWLYFMKFLLQSCVNM